MCEKYTGTIIGYGPLNMGVYVQFTKNGVLKEGYVCGQQNMNLSKKSYRKNQEKQQILQDHLQLGKQVQVSILLETNDTYYDLKIN